MKKLSLFFFCLFTLTHIYAMEKEKASPSWEEKQLASGKLLAAAHWDWKEQAEKVLKQYNLNHLLLSEAAETAASRGNSDVFEVIWNSAKGKLICIPWLEREMARAKPNIKIIECIFKSCRDNEERKYALYDVAEYGSADAIRILLSANFKSDELESAFEEAVRAKNAGTAGVLLGKGIGTEIKDYALWQAVKNDDVKVVSLLVQSGVSEKATKRALRIAIIRENKELVALLKAHCKDTTDEDAFLAALQKGFKNSDEVIAFKEKYYCLADEIRQMFLKAVYDNNVSMVDILLSADEDLKSDCSEALQLAADRAGMVNNIDLIKKLLELSPRDSAKKYALKKAVEQGNIELAKLLHDVMPPKDAYAMPINQNTAPELLSSYELAIKKDDPAMVKQFVCDEKACSAQCKLSGLRWAAVLGSCKVIDFFLNHNPKPEEWLKKDALKDAVKVRQVAAVQTLINAGVEEEPKDLLLGRFKGELLESFMVAEKIDSASLRIIKLLIEAGASKVAKLNLLECAVKCDQYPLVNYLLKADITDQEKIALCECAIRYNRLAISQLILDSPFNDVSLLKKLVDEQFIMLAGASSLELDCYVEILTMLLKKGVSEAAVRKILIEYGLIDKLGVLEALLNADIDAQEFLFDFMATEVANPLPMKVNTARAIGFLSFAPLLRRYNRRAGMPTLGDFYRLASDGRHDGGFCVSFGFFPGEYEKETEKKKNETICKCLKWAVLFNEIDEVKSIINSKRVPRFCINATDEKGYTALDYAIMAGHEKLVDMLVQAGCVYTFNGVEKLDVKRILKAAEYAARHGQYRIANHLIGYWLLCQPHVSAGAEPVLTHTVMVKPKKEAKAKK